MASLLEQMLTRRAGIGKPAFPCHKVAENNGG